MVVSKSESSAREAAQWLQQNAVKFKKLSPTYLTLEEALERSNFFYDKTNHPSAPSRLKKVNSYCCITINNFLIIYSYG